MTERHIRMEREQRERKRERERERHGETHKDVITMERERRLLLLHHGRM